MNLSDKVYYTECNFILNKFEVIETTVGSAIKNFNYNKKEVFEEFEKSQHKNFFILNTVFVNGWMKNYNFYFNKNDAIKELLGELDQKRSKVLEEFSNLNVIRDKLVSEMS